MRIYHFTNNYIATIQHGIQAAHAQSAMTLKYEEIKHDYPEQRKMFWAWLKEPTMYVMDGGDDAALKKLHDFFSPSVNPYPWGEFYEPGMNNLMTNVAIVLPEKIYCAYKELIYGQKYEIAIQRAKSISLQKRQFSSVQKLYDSRTNEGHGAVDMALAEYEIKYGKLSIYDLLLIEEIKQYRRAI